MLNRLASLAPGLEAAITSASQQAQSRVAREVLSWLYCEIPQHERELRSALVRGEAEAANKALTRLDEKYLFLQEQDKPEEALILFSQARAASATLFAIRGAVCEAVYEAIMATDNQAGVSQVAFEALTGNANPSIERTCTGKPVQVSHLKR
jgi:hypothetical protein